MTQVGKDRSCLQCGTQFHGAHLRCRRCRKTERDCVDCGKTFAGDQSKCRTCSATERPCRKCGVTFNGVGTLCGSCRCRPRDCQTCGRRFKGTNFNCGTCQGCERECLLCGKEFRGTNLICGWCGAHERECVECGLVHFEKLKRCYYCRHAERTCKRCGSLFLGVQNTCNPCRGADIRNRLPAHERSRLAAERMQMRIDAAGPEPRKLFAAIRAEGPCVYCGGTPETVDHVVAILDGGTHDEGNLVPCCRSCNTSKGNRRLTRWRRDRVERGVATSPKVAAVHQRQVDAERLAAGMGAAS